MCVCVFSRYPFPCLISPAPHLQEAEELRKAHCCSQPLGEMERRRAMPVAQPVRWWVYLYNRFMS